MLSLGGMYGVQAKKQRLKPGDYTVYYNQTTKMNYFGPNLPFSSLRHCTAKLDEATVIIFGGGERFLGRREGLKWKEFVGNDLPIEEHHKIHLVTFLDPGNPFRFEAKEVPLHGNERNVPIFIPKNIIKKNCYKIGLKLTRTIS